MDMFLKFLTAAIVSATPLLFATLGEIISERAGCLNLGVEGMMWMGAFAGFYAGLRTGSVVLSLVAAFGVAALCAAIYAFLTISLRANQNVTGLTLTTFGIGLSLVLGNAMTQANGGTPSLPTAFTDKLAALSHLLPAGAAAQQSSIVQFLLSFYPLTLAAIVLCIAAAVFYKKTRTGLAIRATGENPAAADAAGVNVSVSKYLSVILGGGICGVGGAFMSLIVANGLWNPSGIVGGVGWIAVALVIFVRWKPLLAVGGALVFGAFQTMRYFIPNAVLALPVAFYQMLPFLLTLVVLVATSVRKKSQTGEPGAIGVNYFREER
ncbi:MAG: ABC transporter permease [Oscillospiraceae bacterium]|jgi:simple sugar transport system permease protein|nr:ABC transporter permease [Oscillospiraceae bacterium]